MHLSTAWRAVAGGTGEGELAAALRLGLTALALLVVAGGWADARAAWSCGQPRGCGRRCGARGDGGSRAAAIALILGVRAVRGRSVAGCGLACVPHRTRTGRVTGRGPGEPRPARVARCAGSPPAAVAQHRSAGLPVCSGCRGGGR